MMDLKQAEAIQQLIPLLQNHEAFVKSNFPSELVPEFAQRADIEFAWQGSQVVKQGDEDKRFFVVISGELKAVDTNNNNRLLNYLYPGDIFGMRAILRNSPRAATVEVVRDAVVAIYDLDDWNWLIGQESSIGEYFENIERRYDDQAEAAFPGLNLQADEVIVRAVKRHFLAFMATLTWPIAILIIPVLFLIGTELMGISLVLTFTAPLALLIVVPFVVLAALVILYNYFDWRNDDLIITTKRVIHMERILFFGEERFEVPLTQIQNVTVISHGWLDLFFDVDDIEIKTAAAGTITVDNVASAQELSRIILTEQLRAKERAAAADTAAVRRQINERLAKNVLAQPQTGAPAPKVVPASSGITLPTITMPNFRTNYFWPSIREVTRIRGEEGILWRKHYYVLLQHVFLPVLAFIFSLYLLLTALANLPYLDYLEGGGWIIELILVLAVLGSLFWYVWEYDDWRRDVYIVTNTKIIDVESSSFRLKGEQLREGSFDSIQNITYIIPNFFYKLLNLGDVVIETAGVGKTFTFSRVLNPSSVQAEIFRRWDAYQQRKRDKQRDDTTKQILSVLGEYHDLTHPPASSNQPAK
ncbi:MAG: cyclic nucleotide-binding domain-containing protein [Anaerolineae bacterium]|nr:cyclic nucleotide-binding domain-containing protein [Anaerolineae bacterium]